jgi:hypothetical protein
MKRTWEKFVFIFMQWKMVDEFSWLFIDVWFYLKYEKRGNNNSY